MTEPGATLGARVAFHRRRRGLSQVDLGKLLNRSESWVSQIERDVRRIDRMSVLESLAQALGVTVADLEPEVPAARTERSAEVASLRAALIGHPALGQSLRPDPSSVLTTNDLVIRRQRVWNLVHGAEVNEAIPKIVDLVRDVEVALEAASESERRGIAEVTASAYQAAASVLARNGETDAAWVASDRALRAATAAEDPGLVAACHFRLGLNFLGAGQTEDALRAGEVAASALEPSIETLPVEVAAVYGAVHLTMAVASARLRNRRQAWAHIRTAEQVAERVGPGRNDHNTEFGPANVALHAVAVAVELGDAGEAIDRAEGVDTSTLSVERHARFLLDVARAHAQRRDIDAATRALLDAEELAPEQVRRHVLAREIARDLLVGEGRRASQDLRAFGSRLGVGAVGN